MVQLAEVPDVVRDLITSGLFYGALGVLTSVAMYHPNLDFTTIYSGYTWLEHRGHSNARGELAAARKVGGRASLCAVGDGRPL